MFGGKYKMNESKSLSARRAWIEIWLDASLKYSPHRSLSARRAWIEMFAGNKEPAQSQVALRKESVDRN